MAEEGMSAEDAARLQSLLSAEDEEDELDYSAPAPAPDPAPLAPAPAPEPPAAPEPESQVDADEALARALATAPEGHEAPEGDVKFGQRVTYHVDGGYSLLELDDPYTPIYTEFSLYQTSNGRQSLLRPYVSNRRKLWVFFILRANSIFVLKEFL